MPSNVPGLKALGDRIDKALTPHAVLGVARDASSSEIRAAYIELVKKFHPDAHPSDPLAERRFMRIQEAYSKLRSRYPIFRAYKAQDARSHSHVLWLAITVFMLSPAAVLLATYGLRETPEPMQLKADTETRSDFSPKAHDPSAGIHISAPPQGEKTDGWPNRQEIALAEPKPHTNAVPQDNSQSIGAFPRAEPVDKEASAHPAGLLRQAPPTAPPGPTKRLQAQKLPRATDRVAKAAVENSIRTPPRQSRYGDFSADDVLRSTRMP